MKLCEGCYVICALLCVYAQPAKKRINGMYISSSKLFDSASNEYGFEDVFATTSSSPKIIEDILEDSEEDLLIRKAITSRPKSKVNLLPLIFEPEAEMLPPGYKGVKSPGVSHMELIFPKRQGYANHKRAIRRALATDSEKSDEFDQNKDAYYAASQHERQQTEDQDSERINILVVGLKGDSKKEDKNVNYTEIVGARKNHSRNEDRTSDYKDENTVGKEAIYEGRNGRRKAFNAAGDRNVYRKNDYEKNADFYGNGHQGGHFKKGDRYDKKYADDTYKKGESNSFKIDEIEIDKMWKLQKTNQGAQDRVMKDSARTWSDS